MNHRCIVLSFDSDDLMSESTEWRWRWSHGDPDGMGIGDGDGDGDWRERWSHGDGPCGHAACTMLGQESLIVSRTVVCRTRTHYTICDTHTHTHTDTHTHSLISQHSTHCESLCESVVCRKRTHYTICDMSHVTHTHTHKSIVDTVDRDSLLGVTPLNPQWRKVYTLHTAYVVSRDIL